MKLVAIAVENHKCFWESQLVSFAPDCTVILGQNSTGKSALLECLRLLDLKSVPHMSSLSLPDRRPPNLPSKVALTLELSGNEIIDAFSWDGRLNVCVPTATGHNLNAVNEFASNLIRSEKLTLKFTRVALPPTYHTPQWQLEAYAGPGIKFSADQATQCQLFIQQLPVVGPGAVALSHAGKTALQGVDLVLGNISNSIFHFSTERFGIGVSESGPTPKLSPNASNLPTVLNHLHATARTRFTRFLSSAKEILPTITDIAIVPIDKQHVEIRVSTDDSYESRDDLSQAVTQGGSGVCQVLAMLYVAMIEKTPQVIILEEPDSFLHPGATRKLMQTLRSQESRHQYIISTHSTEVVRGAVPSAIAHCVWERPQSKVKMLDPNQLDQMRGAFIDLGIQLSDIYGADAILWVEGVTEKLILPFIWASARPDHPETIEFLSVISTGDFDAAKKKHRELVVRVYRELSMAKSLTPPTVGFLFDREKKSGTEIEDMKREYKGAVQYLKRRMIENYLLDSDAIATTIGARLDEAHPKPTADDIDAWISANGLSNEYFDPLPTEKDILSDAWLQNVNGPKLLRDLFLSFGNLTFEKTMHSLTLAKMIFSKNPHAFDEIVQAVDGVLTVARS